MTIIKTSLVVFQLLVQAIPYVHGTATFEWLLLSFDNPNGQADDGICDFWSACDHTFRFGMDYLGGNDNAMDTPIVTKITQTFDNEDYNIFPSNQWIKGIYNPITQTFNSWPGGIKLKAHIEDDDSPLSAADFVDDIVYKIEVQASANELSSTPVTVHASGVRTTLTFTWRVYCDKNYYGIDCTKNCEPSDDTLKGHFICDLNGNKVCLLGWEDINNNCLTKKDDCSTNKCMNGAICIEDVLPYRCSCKPGFTGKMCEVDINECLPNPCNNEATCQDGINNYTCKCSPEFVGKNCSEKACTISSPCQNGGTCYGEKHCLCPPNFLGDTCQDPLCKVVGCLNEGACSINGSCFCKPGFMGSKCDIEICNIVGKFCKNGGMCNEGKCICPKKFTGDACEDSLLCNDFSCDRGVCSVVELIEAKMLVPQCKCPQGYTGERCELVLTDPKGQTIAKLEGVQNNSLSVFGILFIIFIILFGIFFIITIVLAVLLCKKRKTKHHSNSSEMSTSSEIYSTVTETMKCHRNPAGLNYYDNDFSKFPQTDLEKNDIKELWKDSEQFEEVGDKWMKPVDDVFIQGQETNGVKLH